MTKKNERDDKWDFYKGMLMIGVVLGHVLTALQYGNDEPYLIHTFVRTYDMPMFAIISGIFLRKSCRKRGALENILIKTGTILAPAVIWGEIYSLLAGRFVPSVGLWFLYSLFFSSVIIILVDLLKNPMLQVICFTFILAIFHTIVIDPFNIGFLLAPTIVGYYYDSIMGVLNRKVKNNFIEQVWCVIFLIFLVAYSFWDVDYNVWNLGCSVIKNSSYVYNTLGVLFRFIIGILGFFVMKNLFEFIYNGLSMKESGVYNYIRNKVVLWGRHTLELYVLHAWFVSTAGARVVRIICDRLGYNPFIVNERLLLFVIAPTITLFTLYTMQVLAFAIKRIPVVGKYAFSIRIPMTKDINKTIWRDQDGYN